MTAHVHAKLMAEYAKDALETDKPWERWEVCDLGCWEPVTRHPVWNVNVMYRRKRVALCQIEGRDVFPGDKLWWKVEGRWITAVRHSHDTACGLVLWDNETWYALRNLSWSEPKPVLCQVEGRDVVAGDRLWHIDRGWLTAKSMDAGNLVCHTADGMKYRPSHTYLSWGKPPKTKTVYQWAFSTTSDWVSVTYFYETEKAFRENTELPESVEVRRLDYTALEVPV